MTNARALDSPESWRRRVAGTVLLVVLAGLLGAPAAVGDERFVSTVDELVERLREDPVVVEPSMAMGDSERAHEILTEASAEVDRPVYVVLTSVPTELAETDSPTEQAAALLRKELGDGIYHIRFLGEISYTGVWGSSDEFLGTARDASDLAEAKGAGEFPHPTALLDAVLVVRAAAARGDALPDADVEAYLDEPWAFRPPPDEDRANAEASQRVAALAATTGVSVAGVLITALARARPLPARARAPAGQTLEPIPDTARERADQHVLEVRQRLASLPTEQFGSEHVTHASTALRAADQVLDTGDDGLDAVGADVLALIALRELDRVATPDRPAYRPCFANPVHGEAESTASLQGSSVDAPVCGGCADRARFLAVRQGRRWGPYSETATVWARTGFGSLVGDLAEQVLEERSVPR